jgi:hypothetical protein
LQGNQGVIVALVKQQKADDHSEQHRQCDDQEADK